MAFSNDVRDELLNLKLQSKEESISFLSASLIFCGKIVFIGNNKVTFYYVTENAGVARAIVHEFKEVFSESLELYQKKNYNFSRKKIYLLRYNSNKSANDILKKLYIISSEKQTASINEYIEKSLIAGENRCKAFLRGAYLASGSLSNPEKFYHLEFVTGYLGYANSFSRLLNKLGIRSNVLERNDSYIIYVKESESISDFLNYVGAHSNMFKFEDIRIKKQVRNNVNRVVNCETANIEKIAKTFFRQKQSIEYILEKKSIDYLPEDLREVAMLRIENEEDSLQELASKLSTPISKSGINYRLKKIEKIAETLRKEGK
ncbi:DNA-binding protein WhiA [Criibacterium bergeronii]|uniref:Probable cell division protein WhiA n=1 Tax=Criibacterium bergeronii TaxID=1871336 RepID=A0A371IMF5_9FIRM|nr:DNA-binding protein WhiA [Criibacterium bergeronii]MBS6062334.1 DNA-binding protein WhiA [Peptostreptococcaceae bacterium]RDY21683.1 DNA-binding protein WhiA [Criibacterium bergeronii]